MAGAVYSETFLKLMAAGTVSYFVPGGKRAVVRSIVIADRAVAATQVQVGVAGVVVAQFVTRVGAVPEVMDIRAVAYYGDEIFIYQAGSGASTTVSGYLFDDSYESTAPRPLPAPPSSNAPIQPVLPPYE